MCVLLFGIILFSLADLVLTVVHLRTFGMIEANPIAAFLIRTTQSSAALSAYKTATVATCVLLLYRARRLLFCEIASWIGLFVLIALCILWHRYSLAMEQLDLLPMMQAGAMCDQWVRLD